MWLALLPALAYETDQLTERDQPLADVVDAANMKVDELLAQALVQVNASPGCTATEQELRRALSETIHSLTSRDEFVPGRKLAGLGYGHYSAWMETNLPDTRSFADRRDIYGAVGPGGSVILDEIGPCSTFLLAGVLVGSDKPDHFFGEGYEYAVRSKWGRRRGRAIRWGTFTEITYYGLLTSAVFSYADLATNLDGHDFYAGLLRAGSILQRGADGCVYQARPFDWAEWVDARWDEVLNPSVYPHRVQRRVGEHLRAHREGYCSAYARWGAGYADALYPTLQEPVPYAGRRAPARVDPYQLDRLCFGPGAITGDD